ILQKIMQEDLNRYFGSLFNIEGKIEKRKLRAIILIKTADVALSTAGIQTYSEITDSCSEWKNLPFQYVLTRITEGIENINAGCVFVDETGIDNNLNVDMRLTGNLKDIQNLRKQLQLYGLSIIE